MSELDLVKNWFNHLSMINILQAVILLIAGLVVAKLVRASLLRISKKHVNKMGQAILAKITYYLILVPFVLAALNQLGFKLGMLLGITGILTVAIGFAARTSMSNFVSGIFLMVERPFSIGDIVKINKSEGAVQAVNFLSVRLRMANNTVVRIPNELLFKSQMSNLTQFENRRVDLSFDVNIDDEKQWHKAKALLAEAVKENEHCITDPAPGYALLGFDNKKISIQLSAWCLKKDFRKVSNNLQMAVKHAFLDQKIEISSSAKSVEDDAYVQVFE